ncbi:class I SAM-dependent methyltransferase [Actinokineospora sp.]|uniref:class I SAM-dependent methyltransferase n=1 Tax=Actinokineospora sp. TaxID=1872133 RepID=UPI00403846EB
MITAVEAWERFAGKAQPRRDVNGAGATTWFNWTQYPDHGPNESVLGDLRGRTVLELGSGAGSNLAHLATLGALCVGVDLAPSRATTAKQTWGHLANLEFVTADVVDFLTTASTRFDAVYSIFGAVWFTDPAILLPLVRDSMHPGGRFAFAHLPKLDDQPGATDRAVRKRHHSAEQWVRLLTDSGFDAVTADIFPAPAADQPGTLIVRALAK